MPRLNGTLTLLLTMISITACATTSSVPAPFPRPDAPPAAPGGGSSASRSAATGYAIAGTALGLRGTPYRNGGMDPSGFDCSGFVYYVFAQHGLPMPRTVLEQAGVGRQVAQDQLEPGDVVFFSTVSAGPSHVAIAIGGDEFVHAPSSVGQVRVERLSSPYWSTRFVIAKRIL